MGEKKGKGRAGRRGECPQTTKRDVSFPRGEKKGNGGGRGEWLLKRATVPSDSDMAEGREEGEEEG